MKQFKKTPITKERLLSIGFKFVGNKDSFLERYEIKFDSDVIFYYVSDKTVFIRDQFQDTIQLNRKFKTMEDIKELITGLTGKRL